MIFALISPKGGAGKSTLAQCLIYSKVFARRYKRRALVDMDPQGSLRLWHGKRPDGDPVAFERWIRDTALPQQLEGLEAACDCAVLDTPGEGEGGYKVRLGVAVADLVVIPMRLTPHDLASFETHLLPVLEEWRADNRLRAVVVPSFGHPQANPAKLAARYAAVLPEWLAVSRAPFPSRRVFGSFAWDGATLEEHEYRIKVNTILRRQAQRALDDVAAIAKEVIRHAK